MTNAKPDGGWALVIRARAWTTASLVVGLLMLDGALNPFRASTTWNTGDVFAGVAQGDYQVYDNAGNFKETISQPVGGFTTGCAFESTGTLDDDLYTTNFDTSRVYVFDDVSPHAIIQTIDTSLQGGGLAESIVFAANGDFYVGHAGGDADIQRYDAAGNFQQKYNVAVENIGSDWIELSVDQMTMFYTSEGRRIMRYNVAADMQLADFATLPGTTDRAFALRLLAPGDGTGGLLVADLSNVKRLNAAGVVVQMYDVAGEDSWFSLNLDPDGMSFWAGNFESGKFYKFNILTGAVLVTVDTGAPNNLFGLCLKGEPTAAVKQKTLTLSPKTAMNPVDSKHTVTAEVKEDSTPLSGVVVRFQVTGSVNTTGSCTTDTNGQCSFTYTGPPFPGADAIHAFADIDNDGMQDADEPFDDATKTWVFPVTTPGCEIRITNGGWIVANNGDRASFGGNAKADADGNVSGEEEYQDHGPAEPMNLHGNVLIVVCGADGTQATIFGQATIDGSGSHDYRIDVRDLAEPGVGMDTYRMRVNLYDSGEQKLRGGNIQIRRDQ